jgi:hypothetical protein
MGMTMLLAVLRMPPELWDNGPIDQIQRHSRYVEAADLIEKFEADNAELLAALKVVDEHLKHVPDYEYGWINHPEKPERSLADMVRGLIAKAKPAEA